jgi:hypothetical protein
MRRNGAQTLAVGKPFSEPFSEPFAQKKPDMTHKALYPAFVYSNDSGNDAFIGPAYATFRVDKLNRTRVRRIV